MPCCLAQNPHALACLVVVVLSCLVVVLGMRVLQHFCLGVHHVYMNHESWSHAALPRKGPQHAHA